jgi:chromosome segregation ATPase
MTMADRRARQAALMSLHDLAAPLYEATEAAQRLTQHMSDAEELLDGLDGAPADLSATLSTIQEELESITRGLNEARGWAGAAGAIQQSSTLPTADQLWQIDAAWDATPPLVERLNVLITRTVPGFNAAMDAQGVRPDPGAALAVPRRGG